MESDGEPWSAPLRGLLAFQCALTALCAVATGHRPNSLADNGGLFLWLPILAVLAVGWRSRSASPAARVAASALGLLLTGCMALFRSGAVTALRLDALAAEFLYVLILGLGRYRVLSAVSLVGSATVVALELSARRLGLGDARILPVDAYATLCYAAPGIGVVVKAMSLSAERLVEGTRLVRDSFRKIVARVSRTETARSAVDRVFETLTREIEVSSRQAGQVREEFRFYTDFSLAGLVQPVLKLWRSMEDFGSSNPVPVDSEAEDLLRRCNRRAEQMLGAIYGFRTMGEVWSADLHIAVVDISAIAEQVLHDLHDASPGREVRWSVERGIELTCDHRLAERALRHLIDNAWNFSRNTRGALIQVSSTLLDGVPGVSVCGNGPGFDDDEKLRLFEPIYRSDVARQVSGAGIGLSTVRQIVERHGGSIAARSEVGEGVCVSITFGTNSGFPDLEALTQARTRWNEPRLPNLAPPSGSAARTWPRLGNLAALSCLVGAASATVAYGYAGRYLVGMSIAEWAACESGFLLSASALALGAGWTISQRQDAVTRNLGECQEYTNRLDRADELVADSAQVVRALQKLSSLRAKSAAAALDSLESYTGMVIHDLRGPIRSIHGLLHILQDEHAADLGARGVTAVREFQTQIHAINLYVEELISLGQAIRREPTVESLDLQDLLVKTARRSSKDRRARVEQPISMLANQALAELALERLLDDVLASGGELIFSRELAAKDGAVSASGCSGAFLDTVQEFQAPVGAWRVGDDPNWSTLKPLAFVRLCRRQGGAAWVETREDGERRLCFQFAAPP